MPLLLLLVVALLAGAVPAASDDRLLEEGFHALDAGKPSDAIGDFRKVLETESDSLKAHEGLAWAYYESGDFTKAAEHADRRLALAPADTEWRPQWATIVWSVPARQEEVLSTVRRWAGESPADRPAQRLLGRVLADAGNYDEGRRVLKSILAAAPDDVEALATLASIERWDMHYDEARLLLERASALRPTDENLRRDLEDVTKEVAGLRAAHFEPTLPMTLFVIVVSLLIGQIVTKLTLRTHLAVLAGTGALVGLALAWLYWIPIG